MQGAMLLPASAVIVGDLVRIPAERFETWERIQETTMEDSCVELVTHKRRWTVPAWLDLDVEPKS